MVRRVGLSLVFAVALAAVGLGLSTTAEARHGCYGPGGGYGGGGFGVGGYGGHYRAAYVPYGGYGYVPPARSYFGPRYPYPPAWGVGYHQPRSGVSFSIRF